MLVPAPTSKNLPINSQPSILRGDDDEQEPSYGKSYDTAPSPDASAHQAPTPQAPMGAMAAV